MSPASQRPDTDDVEPAAPGLVADEGGMEVTIEGRLHISPLDGQRAVRELGE
jgi:hypothetical protein